jgi:hypothetical protein
VAIRTSLAACLSAVGLVAGCGGGDDGMRATLSDTDCTYRGPTSAHAGRFTIDATNESRSFAAFFVAAVEQDAEVDDLQATIDGLLRRFRKAGESPGRAPWRAIVGAEVGPSERSVIPVDVRAGRYAVLCSVAGSTDTRRTSTEPVPPRAIYVATRLDVTGEPVYP